MSTYELTDGQVERLIALLKGGHTEANPGELIDTLQSQIPQAAPTGRCAVVEDEDGVLWVRLQEGDQDTVPWRSANGNRYVADEELPRPFTVLFDGVAEVSCGA